VFSAKFLTTSDVLGRTNGPLCHDGRMPHASESDEVLPITHIIGVYNARGTLIGELSYLLQRTFTGKHCALCDITHSSVRRRPAWDQCAQSFTQQHSITVELLHLDEVPTSLANNSGFIAPAVYLQRGDNSYSLVMGPRDLEICGHSPEQFFKMLESKIC